MADNGSRTPEASPEEKTTTKVTMPAWILTFIIKWMDTCCELLKMVKFLPKAIQNPTESNVDVVVDSKKEKKWSANYKALDYKVGSLSEGTDTLSCDGSKRSVTKQFNDLTENQVDIVKYFLHDCDTMHTFGDIVVTEDNTQRSQLADSKAAEKDQDMTNRKDKETLNEGGDDNDDEVEEAKPETVNNSRNISAGPLWSNPAYLFGRESKDSEKVQASVESSKNVGYCRLKLKNMNPITQKQHQLLSIFKSGEGDDYLKKPIPNIVKDLVTSYVKKFDLRPDVAIMAEGPRYTLLMFLSSKGRVANGSQSEAQDTVFAVGLDWVPCLRLPQWPKEAEEWITRDRKSNWLDQAFVERVVNAGCHLVPKAHPNNQDDVTEWRISFSEAERILATQLSETQKICFRMFKMVMQLNCKVTDNEKEEYLSSFALKTIFLWECEEIAPTTWEQNPGSRFLGLFEKLAEALENGTIKGYFVPEMNLIGHTDPKLIREYLGLVHEILQDPIKTLAETWKVIIEPKLGWTFDRTFGELIRSADRNDESKDNAHARCSLNLALMINDYICQGAVARNAFKMKMTQEIYGYQRSNKVELEMIENKQDLNLQFREADSSGLDTVIELLDICWHISSKYATNPAFRFGIHAQAFVLSGEVYYMLGRVQEAMKNLEKAIEILTTKGCKVEPRSMSRVYTQYAKCLAALQSPKAMQEYQTALELDQNNTEAQVFKVMLLCRTGLKEEVERVIKEWQILNSTAEGTTNVLPKKNRNMIQLSRGDLTFLDQTLCSEVKALLNWSVKFPAVPYAYQPEAVPKISLPDTLIFSHLYMKGQKITKATLNNELRPWVNLIADTGKMGRADCQYIANSLLGVMNYTAGNYWEALKLLQGLAKTGHCSERVNAHMDLLKTQFKITIE